MRGNWGEAFAIRAMVYLQAARSAKDDAARRENARQASDSMKHAFDLNPLLRIKFQTCAKQIDALL